MTTESPMTPTQAAVITQAFGLRHALSEVARRSPLMLNHRTMQPVKKPDGTPTGEVQATAFDDNHEFNVRLPAWVLRTIQEHARAER